MAVNSWVEEYVSLLMRYDAAPLRHVVRLPAPSAKAATIAADVDADRRVFCSYYVNSLLGMVREYEEGRPLCSFPRLLWSAGMP